MDISLKHTHTSPHHTPHTPHPRHHIPHRYTLNEDHSRDKDRFAAKEREEAIKRAKVMRLADIKARQQVMQHIEEDRK